MENSTLTLNCNYTTYSYTHYVYSTLSYLVFVGNGPAYPNCPNCAYDLTFESTALHNLNGSYIRISNATIDFRSVNDSSYKHGHPVTLSVIGGAAPWVIWSVVNISGEAADPGRDNQSALALMRVVDPFNISWCTVYHALSVPAPEPEDHGECTDAPDELTVLDSRSSIHLQDYPANSSVNLRVFLALNSSSSYSQCSANVSVDNPSRMTNVKIACPTLPLTVNMKMLPANNTDGVSLSATLDIGWLLQSVDGVSLTVKTSQDSPRRSNCTTYRNISAQNMVSQDKSLYVLTHIPTPVNHNNSFSLSWSPLLLNFSKPANGFRLVLYNQQEPSCVLERPDNMTNAVLVSLTCPHLEASFTPGEPIKVDVFGNYSSNVNLNLAFLSSVGTEYAGVLLLPASTDLYAPPGTVASTPDSVSDPSPSSPAPAPLPAEPPHIPQTRRAAVTPEPETGMSPVRGPRVRARRSVSSTTGSARASTSSYSTSEATSSAVSEATSSTPMPSLTSSAPSSTSGHSLEEASGSFSSGSTSSPSSPGPTPSTPPSTTSPPTTPAPPTNSVTSTAVSTSTAISTKGTLTSRSPETQSPTAPPSPTKSESSILTTAIPPPDTSFTPQMPTEATPLSPTFPFTPAASSVSSATLGSPLPPPKKPFPSTPLSPESAVVPTDSTLAESTEGPSVEPTLSTQMPFSPSDGGSPGPPEVAPSALTKPTKHPASTTTAQGSHPSSHAIRRLPTPRDGPLDDPTTPPVIEHHERMKIWLLPVAGTIFAIVMLVIVNIVLCLTE